MSGRDPNHMTLKLKIFSTKQDWLIKNIANEMQKILTCNLWRKYPLNVDRMIPKTFRGIGGTDLANCLAKQRLHLLQKTSTLMN